LKYTQINRGNIKKTRKKEDMKEKKRNRGEIFVLIVNIGVDTAEIWNPKNLS